MAVTCDIRVEREVDGYRFNHHPERDVPIHELESVLDDHAGLPGRVVMITVVVDNDGF
jgi:hypothetical protein